MITTYIFLSQSLLPQILIHYLPPDNYDVSALEGILEVVFVPLVTPVRRPLLSGQLTRILTMK